MPLHLLQRHSDVSSLAQSLIDRIFAVLRFVLSSLLRFRALYPHAAQSYLAIYQRGSFVPLLQKACVRLTRFSLPAHPRFRSDHSRLRNRQRTRWVDRQTLPTTGRMDSLHCPAHQESLARLARDQRVVRRSPRRTHHQRGRHCVSSPPSSFGTLPASH